MGIYGDVVAIAATTSGVAGTITVPQGAKLIGINLAATGTTASAILSSVEVKWAGSNIYKFVPNIIMVDSTNGPALGACKSPLINLSKLPTVGQNTVTITLTSTANVTVEVGLMWMA